MSFYNKPFTKAGKIYIQNRKIAFTLLGQIVILKRMNFKNIIFILLKNSFYTKFV